MGGAARFGADTLQPAFPGFDRRLSPAARQRDRRRRPVCLGHRAVFAPRGFQPHRRRRRHRPHRDISRDMISPKPCFRPPHFVSW